MSLNRLLFLPKPATLHLHKLGAPKSTRWCSSMEFSGAQKPSSSVNLEATMKKESDNKYLEKHSESFLRPTKILNTLIGLFTTLKEKMPGSSQLQKQNTLQIMDSAADRRVSEVIKTKYTPQDSETGLPNDSILMQKDIRNSQSCKPNSLTSLGSHIDEDSSTDFLIATPFDKVKVPKNMSHPSAGTVCSSENLVGAIDSEVKKESVDERSSRSKLLPIMQRSYEVPKKVEHSKNGSLDQTLEAITTSHNNEKRVTVTSASKTVTSQSGAAPQSTEPSEAVLLGSDSGCLSSSTDELPGEVSKILQKNVANGSTVVRNGNHEPRKRTWTLDQPPTAVSDMGIIHGSSNGSHQAMRLAKLFVKTMNNQQAAEMTSNKNDILNSNGVLEVSVETDEKTTIKEDTRKRDKICFGGVLEVQNRTDEKTCKEVAGKTFDISGLIGLISTLPLQSSTTTSLGGRAEKVSSVNNPQVSDTKMKEGPMRGPAMGREASTPCGTDKLKVPARTKPNLKPASKEDFDEIPGTTYLNEEPTENKVLVRFLPKDVQESALLMSFGACGEIVKIQLLPLMDGSNFKDAYVHFKTRKGSQKALGKRDYFVEGAFCVVVHATSSEDVPNKISIPNLIGDPEVPLMLVKNPKLTVMIKQFTHDISAHQLKEALAFCGSGISGIFLGSSSSVAYVEFETEDAKERALAAYSVNVQQKKLLISRIDMPRTTVVRISNIDDAQYGVRYLNSKVIPICKTLGQVYTIKQRSCCSWDVYFKLSEWPNMLSILNRLNGMEVDSCRWVAQPAPVFPPQILEALWSEPDERIHVKSVLLRLLQNAEVSTSISNLITNYYNE